MQQPLESETSNMRNRGRNLMRVPLRVALIMPDMRLAVPLGWGLSTVISSSPRPGLPKLWLRMPSTSIRLTVGAQGIHFAHMAFSIVAAIKACGCAGNLGRFCPHLPCTRFVNTNSLAAAPTADQLHLDIVSEFPPHTVSCCGLFCSYLSDVRPFHRR